MLYAFLGFLGFALNCQNMWEIQYMKSWCHGNVITWFLECSGVLDIFNFLTMSYLIKNHKRQDLTIEELVYDFKCIPLNFWSTNFIHFSSEFSPSKHLVLKDYSHHTKNSKKVFYIISKLLCIICYWFGI